MSGVLALSVDLEEGYHSRRCNPITRATRTWRGAGTLSWWRSRCWIWDGNTAFYLQPWEVGPKPDPDDGDPMRNLVFLQRTGPWMLRAVERLLQHFRGRIVTARESAASFVPTA